MIATKCVLIFFIASKCIFILLSIECKTDLEKVLIQSRSCFVLAAGNNYYYHCKVRGKLFIAGVFGVDECQINQRISKFELLTASGRSKTRNNFFCLAKRIAQGY